MPRVMSVVVCCGLWYASGAKAHDPNLARWDVVARGEHLELTLRTSGHGLHSSLSATDATVDWDALDVASYERRLQAFLGEAVVLSEDGAPLTLEAGDYRYGHEAHVTLSYARRHEGALASLQLALDGYTDRANQHHVVFVHHGDARTRVMLPPGEPYVLTWPEPDDSAVSRSPAHVPTLPAFAVRILPLALGGIALVSVAMARIRKAAPTPPGERP